MWRYDPDTRRRVRVEADSPEAELWSSRKPRKKSATRRRLERRLETRVEQRIERGLGALARPGAAAAAGRLALSAGYLAVAGAAAYAATSAIRDGMAQGETLQNLTALAFAKAHRELARRLGRKPTRDELHDLYRRVARELTTALRAGLIPGGTGVLQLIQLLRR